MKKLFSLCLMICLTYASTLFGQTHPDRYKSVIFVTIPAPTTNVAFSTSIPHVTTTNLFGNQIADETTYGGVTLTLFMNIYQPPVSDTVTRRPVIIFCFGGGFVTGNRTMTDMTQLCQLYARRGFVTATIDYRIGMNLSDEERSKRAVYRGVQDGRSAVRFFRQHANMLNYKVDPDQIFIGGHSAGGFVAMHNLYLDELERPASTRSYLGLLDLGGLDGIGNNKTQTSGPNAGALISGKANGGISFAGALGDVTYIDDANDAPAAYFHSSDDGTIPYNSGEPFSSLNWLPGFNLPDVFGGNAMNTRANAVNAPRVFYPYTGAGARDHGVHYDGSNIYSDIPVRGGLFTWDFRLKPLIPTIAPTIICDRNLTQNISLGNNVTISAYQNFYYEWSIVGGTINTPSSPTAYSATSREYLSTINVTWNAAAPTRSISVWIYQRNLARANAIFTQTFTLNNAPVAATAVPTQNIQINGGNQTVNIASAFTDANGNPMTYTVSSSNTANLNVSVVGGIVTLTPVLSGTGGAVTVTLIANDNIGGGCASLPVTFVVNINRPPVATAIPVQTLILGGTNSTLNVASFFSDPDGNTLTFGSTNGTPAIATATLAGTIFTLTPLTLGSTIVTINVSDGNGGTVTQTFTVNVVCPIITFAPSTVTNAVIGVPYTVGTSATGNTAPLTYSVSPALLPAGLSLNTSTGEISGTPTATATITNYTVTATQGTIPNACTSTQVYNFAVACPTITFATSTVTNAIIGTPYTVGTSATGNTAPLTYSVSPALLPAGLSFNTGTGEISGTPTALAIATNYTVTASQSAGVCTQTRVYNFAVVCPTITILPATLPSVVVNTSGYNQTISQTGLTGTLAWSVIGALPIGLSIAPTTGIISGTPTTIGTANFTIQVTNGVCTQTIAYSIVVNCPTITFTTGTVINGVVGTTFALGTGATGNTATLTYSVLPTLPAGLSINSATGAISGTPTSATTSATYTVTATQGTAPNICSGVQTYTFSVSCPTITFTNTTAPNGAVGASYSLNAGATGNTATLTYSVSSLPLGLSLDPSTGVISGTPTTPTLSATYTVTATQGTTPNICSATQTYTFAVNCAGVFITPSTLPNGTATVAYNQTLTSNLTGTLTYSVMPSLPLGISLSASGVISGTSAVVVASVAYTVSATNGTCSASQVYNIAFLTPCTPVVLTPNLLALPNATIGTAYSQTITATGGAIVGTTTYTFSTLTPLPSGLSFVNGTISGVPTFSTSVTFSVVATTPSGCNGSRTYTLVVLADPTTAIDTFANQIKVYPNPSKGIFNVDLNGLNLGKSPIRVYDAQGKVIYSSEINANQTTISLENRASGLYLMEIVSEKGRILKRLVKE